MSRETWKTRPPGPGDLPPIVARAVRRQRESAGLTQQELADKMVTLGFAWNYVTVSHTEAGRRRLDVPELLALAAILRAPVVDLIVPRSLYADYIEEVADPVAVRELIVGRGDGDYDDWTAADALHTAWGRDPS